MDGADMWEYEQFYLMSLLYFLPNPAILLPIMYYVGAGSSLKYSPTRELEQIKQLIFLLES